MQPSDGAAIKRLARDKALQLGASDVRVAPASADGALRETLRESFGRGDFTTWPYDDAYANKASDPGSVLRGARSVICIAVPYDAVSVPYRPESISVPNEPESVILNGPMRGRVSNYVGSADYHRRVKDLLQIVAGEIDAAAGEPVTAIACDTKPIAERAFAARAGLGWIGKHTNLITPAAGSFVFLGEIVTKLDLPPDEPLKKTCGSCTRCIVACPTGALRGDYTIDATRCIADLTQRTDAIPRDMRALIGTWVWGCDLCQLVCPPNNIHAKQNAQSCHPEWGPEGDPNRRAERGAAYTCHPERGAVGDPSRRAEPSTETSSPELIRLLKLRSGQFKKTYKRSAMGWRGGAILRRNAAVALGNALDRAAVPALAEALNRDPHPLVRGHAAWALGRIGSPPAVDALRTRLASERDASVVEEIGAALEPLKSGYR